MVDFWTTAGSSEFARIVALSLGVSLSATAISVIGRGESQPLVQTADGVREPQNRRVEIVIQ